jgi:preprotein translocase subunit YajC
MRDFFEIPGCALWAPSINPQITGDASKMDWLISTAAAQAAGGSVGGSNLMTLLFPVAMIVVFYFLLIRPQNKRAKEHKELVAALESGAEVVTSGGILGKVTEVNDQFVSVDIADGVNVKVQRHTITQILPKGTIKAI